MHTDHADTTGMRPLLESHGLKCCSHAVDVTDSDEFAVNNYCVTFYNNTKNGYSWYEWLSKYGEQLRAFQIYQYLKEASTSSAANVTYVVVDDLDLPIQNLVRTDKNTGLTAKNIKEIIDILTKEE